MKQRHFIRPMRFQPVSPKISRHQALAVCKKIRSGQSVADGNFRVTKGLEKGPAKPSGAGAYRSRKGWSPERRARQAALIRRVKPWEHSTGPKTEAGKARCAMNALRHGGRSRARILELRKVRYVLRLAARNIALVHPP